MRDEEIIAMFWARSDQALTCTAERYGSYCYTIANRILDDPEDSKECLNDALLKLWNQIPPNRPHNLATFLGKLTRNLALDRLRSRAAEKRGGGRTDAVLEELADCIPAGTAEDKVIDAIVLRDLLADFLDGQKQQNRIIFVKRYWYLMTVDEIARELGASRSKVKMSLLRTRNALQERLEKEGLL